MTTNVRLVNRWGENGGEYTIPPDRPEGMSRVYRDLAEYRDLEPDSDWHLETRGTIATWHRMHD